MLLKVIMQSIIKNGIIILKRNVEAIDSKKNKILTNHAIYNENLKILKSIGPTSVYTAENYSLEGNDILFDDTNKFISSDKKTIITDQDQNKIFLENFKYLTNDFIFKSIGNIKIEDSFENIYNFSQIYIDTKKKELLGTDAKTFINKKDFKTNNKNKPRVFANTINIKKEITTFEKSNFTICDYRENDKCPPWAIQSSRMLHDRKKNYLLRQCLNKNL